MDPRTDLPGPAATTAVTTAATPGLTVTAAVAALLVLAALPAAGAGIGPADAVPGIPGFAAGPLPDPGDGRAPPPFPCTDTCEVPSHVAGYVPPVLPIASGAQVVWSSLDTSHVHVETDLAEPGPCFRVSSSTNRDAVPVRFDIVGDALVATRNPGTPFAVTKVCADAVQAPAGSFALAYHCDIHPNMRAELVVTPRGY